MDYDYIITPLYNLLCARLLSNALQRLQGTQVPLVRPGVQQNFWYEQGYQRKRSFQSCNYQDQNGAQFATVRTSGMFRAENTCSDTRLASAEFSCYPGYGFDSFSEFESDRLPCRETYQYNNFDVASRLHPELPDIGPELDYQGPSPYPPTENMYNERRNWRPYTNPRYDNWQPRRRSHLDDIYFPNYDTDDDFTNNRAGCSANTPIRIYENYPPRGISVLHKVKNILPRKRRKNRMSIINVTHKPNNTDGDKLVDKQLSERVNSTANIIDVTATTEVDIVNDCKQSLEVKSVPCTTKSSDIEMPSKQSEATSSESGQQNVNDMETVRGVDVRENNDSNAEEQLISTTDNSSNNCSQVYLADEDKSCPLSNGFVDSRVLELNITSPIKENTDSPKKRKLDTINFKQILTNLSGILQEDGQLKSNTGTNQTEMIDKSSAMSGDDLLELLQSSISCSSDSVMEGLDMKSNLNGCRRMYSKSSANSAKISKIIDKPIQKDKIPKPENKASNKNPYFPTLAHYSIPKLTATRKNEFSDTNELYLDRMHTLFGSDYSENESADESSSRTSKMKGVAKEKTVGSKEKLSKSSIEKNKSDHKRKVEWKRFKPSKKHSTELKKIAKRRHSLEIIRSPKMQQSELKAKLMEKSFTGKNEDRRFPKLPESELKASDEAKLIDKHSTRKNEGRRLSSNIQESELKDINNVKLVDKHSTWKNEDRKTPKIQESESKAPNHTKLMDKFPTGKNDDIRSPKLVQSELKNSDKNCTGKNEDRGLPKIQKLDSKDSKQAKSVDKLSSAKNEDRRYNKIQKSELKVSTLAKLVDNHSTGQNEDRVSPKMQESEMKEENHTKLEDRHSTDHNEGRRTPKIQELDFKVPTQVKLLEKQSTEKNENRRSPKIPASEWKAADHVKLVDKHPTGPNDDRRSPKLVDEHSTGHIEDKKTPKLPESELKDSEQDKLVDKNSTGQGVDRRSPNIQELGLEAADQVIVVDKHSTGPNEAKRSPKVQESELQAKLVDNRPTGSNEDMTSSKVQKSELKAPTQSKLENKHSMGRKEDKVSPKIPTTELKASDKAKLLEKHSTGKNQDNCRTDYKIINGQEKMAYKRSHNPDQTSNKRRRTSAEEIMTDIKKTKTKIVTNNTKETILKKINNTADTDIKQCNKSKSDNSATNDKYQTNITSDSIKAIISEECKATKTGDVESRSHADNKTEQSSEVGSSNSSTVTHAEKDLTSLLKNGIVSFEKVPFFHSSPISPFQLPLRQTISRCSIVLNDCCDEAVTLERPDIKEIVQIIVNKSVKHITDGIIEIVPNIPVIDLTDDGDSKEAQLSGISEPELSCRSKDSTTIGTKQELLDILTEQSDKSVSPSEQITLYRSDETLNNSLEIQATSASISTAAVSSTGMVHPGVASEVKQGKHLKVEDDSGVDMNESEEEGNKISSTVTNNSRSTCIVVSPRPATAASEDNHNIVSRSNVPNTSTTALQAIVTESHSLVTNSLKFPVNTRNSCILSTNSSVLPRNLTNSSRLPGDTFMPPPNKSVLDIPSSSQNTDCAIPIVELPALQAIGSMQQQADVNGSGLQSASRNNISRNRERSPPPAYPGMTPRYVHTSCNNPVGQSTTNNGHCNIPPTHNTMETYKKDFNNLGALLVEYLLFFKNMKKAQCNYICNIKKGCATSPLLLANELCRFQDYYRDNMTVLRTSLKMAVQNLNLSSFMKVHDVPNFLNAIEICLFQESSLTSKTSVVLWLHSLMAGCEDYYFWHGSLYCLYRYLETAVEKLRCRSQSGLPLSTDPLSLQQRNLLKNQIEEYNRICAKCILMHERTANLTTDLTGNESNQVSGKTRKSKTNSAHNTFQKIRLPLTVPYDVNVSTASIRTSALSSRTSVVSSTTTPTRGLTSVSNGTELNSQLMQLNHSAGAANSPVYPGTRNHPNRITNITTPPRTDSSPVHTSSSLNYSVRVAQEKLAKMLNYSMNNDMSDRNTTATRNFPTQALSVVGSPTHQPVQQSNPPVYNSPAQSTPMRNSPVPTSAVNIPARLTSTLKSPAHVPAALNSPTDITAAFNSPGHSPAALNTNGSDNSYIFKPPQAQHRFRCPSSRVQQTSSVSMSPSQYSGQSSTIASGVQASPLRNLQDLVESSSANANSTVEKESLTLRSLLESSKRATSNNLADPSTTNDIGEKSPVYAPMLFSPSNHQVDEVDNGDNIETIDLTWVDDVDADHLQMEIDYFVKKEEPSEENHVVLNQEQFPVTPSPTDSGIASPPVQGEISELYTNRTCICANRAEYICGCRQAMYCSIPCQKQDWASHKAICLKYNAKNKETTSLGEQQ